MSKRGFVTSDFFRILEMSDKCPLTCPILIFFIAENVGQCNNLEFGREFELP